MKRRPAVLLLHRLVLGLLLGGLGVRSWAASGRPAPEVIVLSDVTKAGRQARVPDDAHPVYYMPLAPGLLEKDPAPAIVDPALRKEVLGRLVSALAKRHYLLMAPGHPPEVVLAFEWGSVEPEIDSMGSDDPLDADFVNERGMVALVGANRKQELMMWHRRDLRDAAREARHYVIVTAFDYAAATQKQKKVLWITRMSTPSSGTDLAAVIPALVASGTAALGREVAPSWVDSSKVQDEHVILAPLEVQGVIPNKGK